jgi:thiol-disulfide isomerase/thioredoxin
MRRMIAAGPPSKRPPHSALARSSGAGSGRLSAAAALFATACVALLYALSATAPAAAADDKIRLGEFIPVAPPQPTPVVAFIDSAGKPAKLGDLAGEPTVVNLWATWCQPCLREMPSLEQLQSDLAGRLRVAAIAEDSGGAKIVAPFIARQQLTHLKIYLDPKEAVAQAFGVRGLPTSIVLDAKGRVVGRIEGPADWTSARMLAVLRPLLEAGDASVKHAAAR